MAYIFKPKKSSQRVPTERKQEDQSIYQSDRWRRIKQARRANNPLCSVCLENGKTTPAEDIHHITPFSEGETLKDKKALAYDYNNTMSVCKACHAKLHKELRNSKLNS